MGALPSLRAATDPGVLGGQYFGPRGILEQRGLPESRRLEPSSSYDIAVQQRLWTVSEELTKVVFPCRLDRTPYKTNSRRVIMSKWTTADIPDQTGRTAVITGANTGLGYETAAALAAKGAHVVLAVRNLDKGKEAARASSRPARARTSTCRNST